MVKGRWAMLLLVVFLVGEIWLHGMQNANHAHQTAAPPAPKRAWTQMAPGAYAPVSGESVLLSSSHGPSLLSGGPGNPVPSETTPSSQVAVPGGGKLYLWGGSSRLTAAAVVGSRGLTPAALSAGGHYAAFTDPAYQTVYLYTASSGALRAVVPKVLAGYNLEHMLARAKALQTKGTIARDYHVIWAKHPLFGPHDEIYYLSNRTSPIGDESLSLWVHSHQGDHLLLNGAPLGSLWMVGFLPDGELLLSDGRAEVIGYFPNSGERQIVKMDAAPLALSHTGVLCYEDYKDLTIRLYDAHHNRSGLVKLPKGTGFAGKAAFSATSKRLAVLVAPTNNPGRRQLALYTVDGTTAKLLKVVAPPSGTTLSPTSAPSWLGDQALVAAAKKAGSGGFGTWVWQAGR